MSNTMFAMSQVAAANTPAPWKWNLNYAYYDPTASGKLATSVFFNLISVSATSSQPTGVFVSPDGLKVFVLDNGSDNVWLYTLGSPWTINTATYSGVSFSVSSQEAYPTGISFRSDGMKMYIIGYGSDKVHQYSLGTPWDISTTTYDAVSYSVLAQSGGMKDLCFSSDGYGMYAIDNSYGKVFQYSLSTAWDISTASYLQQFSVLNQDGSPSGLTFSKDGTRMYFCGKQFYLTYEYVLATPWDISTAVFSTQISTSSGTRPEAIFLGDNDTRLFAINEETDILVQNTLGSYYVGNRETKPEALSFSSDGSKLYVLGTTGDDVNQFNLSSPWDISTAVYSTVFSVASQTASPFSLHFKPDGTKMYVSGSSSVFEYSLSTPWSISTANVSSTFSTAGVNTVPESVSFSGDGSVMFILGTDSTKSIYKYELSTPWSVITASHTQTLSIADRYSSPHGIFLHPNGDKFFVVGQTGELSEYSMGVAFDLTTAVYTTKFSYSTENANMRGVYFRDDGEKFFMIENSGDRVYEYSMGAGN